MLLDKAFHCCTQHYETLAACHGAFSSELKHFPEVESNKTHEVIKTHKSEEAPETAKIHKVSPPHTHTLTKVKWEGTLWGKQTEKLKDSTFVTHGLSRIEVFDSSTAFESSSLVPM